MFNWKKALKHFQQQFFLLFFYLKFNFFSRFVVSGYCYLTITFFIAKQRVQLRFFDAKLHHKLCTTMSSRIFSPFHHNCDKTWRTFYILHRGWEKWIFPLGDQTFTCILVWITICSRIKNCLFVKLLL